MNKNVVGFNIKKYRKQKKITQKELGNLLDKSLSTIQKYESGEIEVTLDILMKISNLLDVDIYQILYEEGSESYKEWQAEQEHESTLDKSYEALGRILNSNNMYNFTQKNIDTILEGLGLAYIFDNYKNLVYIHGYRSQDSDMGVVTDINSFLNMIKNIHSIRDNFLNTYPSHNLTNSEVLDLISINEGDNIGQ